MTVAFFFKNSRFGAFAFFFGKKKRKKKKKKKKRNIRAFLQTKISLQIFRSKQSKNWSRKKWKKSFCAPKISFQFISSFLCTLHDVQKKNRPRYLQLTPKANEG